MKKKILAVQLLRIGDVLMTLPPLRAYKNKHPDHHVTLLVNKFCKATLYDLLKLYVDEVICFDRGFAVHSLTSTSAPLFEAIDYIRDFQKQLRSSEYDKIVNFTHNKFSAYLLSKCNEESILGMGSRENGELYINGKSFRELNEYKGSESRHFIDIFYNALGLQPQNLGHAKLPVNPSGQSYICIQPFTSDEKKNWGESNWRDFILQLDRLRFPFDIFVLGAPFEKEKIERLSSTCKTKHLKVEAKITSFIEAKDLLEKSSFLVTGDTSILHLSNITRTPVLEIALGSSQVNETGAYLKNSLIVRPKLSCFPCEHSQNCKMNSHLCADYVQPKDIALLVFSKILQAGLETVGEFCGNNLEVLKVEKIGVNWKLKTINGEQPLDVETRVKDRTV